MNIQERAMIASKLELESKRELPIIIEGIQFQHTSSPILNVDGQPVVCKTRKFTGVTQMQKILSNAPGKLYIHKLYELDEYGENLQTTGQKYYHLSYAIVG